MQIGFGVNYKEFLTGMKRIESELKGFTKEAQSWSKNLSSLAGAATGLFAMNQFGSFLESATKKAIDSELNIKKLRAVLAATGGAAGVTAEKLDEISSSLSGVTNFSKATILEAERIVLTFKGIKGDNFEKTMNLAADLADTFSIQLPQAATMLSKALEMPTVGLRNLRRVGVSFTEQEMELIKSMDQAGNKAGAQGKIFEILATQFGGVATAAGDTASGKLLQFDKLIGGIKKSIGELVMTAIMPFIDAISSLVKWYKSMDDSTRKVINVVLAITAGLAAVIPIIMGIVAAIPLIGAAFTATFTAVNMATGGITIAIGLLATAAVVMWQKWDQISAWFEKMWIKMKITVTDGVLSILRAINNLLEPLGLSLYGAISKVQTANLEAKTAMLALSNQMFYQQKAATEAAKANDQLAQSFSNGPDTSTIAGVGELLKELNSQLETTASTAQRVQLIKDIDYWTAQQKSMKETGQTLQQLRKQQEMSMTPMKARKFGGFENAIPDTLPNRDKLIADADYLANSVLVSIQGIPIKAKDAWNAINEGLSAGFQNLGQRFVDSLNLAKTGFEGFIGVMAQFAAKMISMVLGQSIANAILGATASGAATGPAAIFTTPAFITEAVATVIGAFAAIPKFAKGGIATRPTLGIFGEAGPEALIPLNQVNQFGMGGGRMQVQVVGQLSGRELRIVNKYANQAYTLKTGRK